MYKSIRNQIKQLIRDGAFEAWKLQDDCDIF